MKIEQDMVCVLLQSLRDRELISKDVHEKAREKTLDILVWPDFFCYGSREEKEATYGST